MSALGFTRLALAIRLPELPFTVPTAYLALSGAAWGIIALLTAFGLLRGAAWAPTLTRATALALAGCYWGDRLLFARGDYTGRSWPAAALVTLLALVSLQWVLSRPAAKVFFRENSG